MKLLFAEDEVSMAEAVTDILTYHNYTVDTFMTVPTLLITQEPNSMTG